MHGCRPATLGPAAVVDHCLNVLAHNTQCSTLMSAKQARRAMRRGASTMLAIVRPDAPAPTAPDGPPDAVLARLVPDASLQGSPRGFSERVLPPSRPTSPHDTH